MTVLLVASAARATEEASDPQVEAALRRKSTQDLQDLFVHLNERVDVASKLKLFRYGKEPSNNHAVLSRRLYEYIGFSLQLRTLFDREKKKVSEACERFLKVDNSLHELLEKSAVQYGGFSASYSRPDGYGKLILEARATLAFSLMPSFASLVQNDFEAGVSVLGLASRPCAITDRDRWKELYLQRQAAAARLFEAGFGVRGLINVRRLLVEMRREFELRENAEWWANIREEAAYFGVNAALSALAFVHVARGLQALQWASRATWVAGSLVGGASSAITTYARGRGQVALPAAIVNDWASIVTEGERVIELAQNARYSVEPYFASILKIETDWANYLTAELGALRESERELVREWGDIDEAFEAKSNQLAAVAAELRNRTPAIRP